MIEFIANRAAQIVLVAGETVGAGLSMGDIIQSLVQEPFTFLINNSLLSTRAWLAARTGTSCIAAYRLG